jgi:hypothetical protein
MPAVTIKNIHKDINGEYTVDILNQVRNSSIIAIALPDGKPAAGIVITTDGWKSRKLRFEGKPEDAPEVVNVNLDISTHENTQLGTAVIVAITSFVSALIPACLAYYRGRDDDALHSYTTVSDRLGQAGLCDKSLSGHACVDQAIDKIQKGYETLISSASLGQEEAMGTAERMDHLQDEMILAIRDGLCSGDDVDACFALMRRHIKSLFGLACDSTHKWTELLQGSGSGVGTQGFDAVSGTQGANTGSDAAATSRQQCRELLQKRFDEGLTP